MDVVSEFVECQVGFYILPFFFASLFLLSIFFVVAWDMIYLLDLFFFGLSSGNGTDQMRLMRMKYEEIMGADKMIVIPRGNKDLETHHTHQV